MLTCWHWCWEHVCHDCSKPMSTKMDHPWVPFYGLLGDDSPKPGDSSFCCWLYIPFYSPSYSHCIHLNEYTSHSIYPWYIHSDPIRIPFIFHQHSIHIPYMFMILFHYITFYNNYCWLNHSFCHIKTVSHYYTVMRSLLFIQIAIIPFRSQLDPIHVPLIVHEYFIDIPLYSGIYNIYIQYIYIYKQCLPWVEFPYGWELGVPPEKSTQVSESCSSSARDIYEGTSVGNESIPRENPPEIHAKSHG